MILALKMIIGYLLIMCSIATIVYIAKGWNDTEIDTENNMLKILHFIAHNYDLFALAFILAGFGLLLVAKPL